MKQKLTNRQLKILEFIEERIVQHGHSPTIREIGGHFGISSTNGVRTHLAALIKKGYLKKHGLISRGLELTRKLASDIRRIPLVGAVPAGNPIDSAENIEGEIALDSSFLPKGEKFSLRVTGDSMINDGIFDGDMIVVKKQEIAEAGEIVVAIVDGEATVKRYYPEGKQVRLQPANDQFKPIVVSKSNGEFRIAGKVVGLLRRMS